MNRRAWMAAMLGMSLVALTACASRRESLVRERRYVKDHPPEQVAHYWDEVEYARPAGQSLTMDISAPEGPGPFPCLMVIHGGGWYMHTNLVMEGMSRYITNRGYVVFNINYRMVPRAHMKEIVEDCLGALLWIKDHAAEYRADPARLAVTGDSAGGHLTAMLVTQAQDPAFKPSYQGQSNDRSIACAIPTYGIYDLVSRGMAVDAFMNRVVGVPYKKDPALYALLSPSRHVRQDLPPQLVLVGDKDPLLSENQNYVDALRAVGAPVEIEIYPGLGHAFLNNFWAPEGRNGMDRMIKFMDAHLKK